MHEIERSFANLTLHAPQVHRNLTLFPLVAADDAPRDYLLLDEALERGLARITEVSEGGRVPELAFENLSERRILLVDGDVLAGAKQNRTINLSILVAPGMKLAIPVSCVEQGRWSYRSREFAPSGDMLYARARSTKMERVSESLRRSGQRHADQSALWNDIAAKVRFTDAAASTMSMNDAYGAAAADLAGYQAAFRAAPRQRGAVIAVDGEVAGIELFDSADAFAKLLPKLVRAYAIDAIETARVDAPSATEEAAMRFLERIKAAAVERYKAVGEGEDLRIAGDGVAGGALGWEARVVHGAVHAVA